MPPNEHAGKNPLAPEPHLRARRGRGRARDVRPRQPRLLPDLRRRGRRLRARRPQLPMRDLRRSSGLRRRRAAADDGAAAMSGGNPHLYISTAPRGRQWRVALKQFRGWNLLDITVEEVVTSKAQALRLIRRWRTEHN